MCGECCGAAVAQAVLLAVLRCCSGGGLLGTSWDYDGDRVSTRVGTWRLQLADSLSVHGTCWMQKRSRLRTRGGLCCVRWAPFPQRLTLHGICAASLGLFSGC
jgi:hypothetical protein